MYKKLHSAHTNHPITFDDGSSSTRYCRYEKGVVSGEYRDIQALIADEGGFDGLGFDASAGSNDDSWRVLNIFKDAGRYVDTVVIAGAMDDDHALTIADTQFDHLGGDYSVVVALDTDHQFDSLNNQGDVWSIDAIQKLASNPSQDKHYLPVITAQELAVEATRATFDSVAWDGESLSSHGGDDGRLYIDLVKADTFNDLVGEFNLRDELVSIGAETTSFDSLMDTNNRLPLLKDRLYKAMVRAGSGEVQVTNVTQTKPFKRQGVSNVAFVFDLSDGQKLSIWFHNPDSTPTKLMPSDIMISWKWLLNKRDVTAVLSPKNGDNVQLPMLASRIMRLANKNSKRFKRTQASRLKTEAELQKAQELVVTKTVVIEQLDKDIASLQGQIDQALVTAKEKAEATAQAPKSTMDLEPLDHGVLSMPNRTKNIDKELDKYNEQKAKDERRKLDDIKFVNGERIAQEKTDMQPVKEKAWEEYKKYGTAMIKKHGAMLPFKLGDGYNNNLNPRDFLKELAKYEPKRFLEALDWHLKGGEFESPAEPADEGAATVKQLVAAKGWDLIYAERLQDRFGISKTVSNNEEYKLLYQLKELDKPILVLASDASGEKFYSVWSNDKGSWEQLGEYDIEAIKKLENLIRKRAETEITNSENQGDLSAANYDLESENADSESVEYENAKQAVIDFASGKQGFLGVVDKGSEDSIVSKEPGSWVVSLSKVSDGFWHSIFYSLPDSKYTGVSGRTIEEAYKELIGDNLYQSIANQSAYSQEDIDYLQSIISGTTSADDVDMDKVIEIGEKDENDPLFNEALEVVLAAVDAESANL